MRRIAELIRKELLQLSRDRRLLPLLFMAPVLQLALLGYAATTDVRNVPVALCDLDRSAASRSLAEAFTASGEFRVVRQVDGLPAIDALLDAGRADLAVVVPLAFGRDLAAGRPVTVQLAVDGSKVSATIALNRLAATVADYGRRRAEDVRARLGGPARQPEVDAQVRVWYNPGLSSRYYMVPGVLAFILMVVSTVVTSMAVVREKEAGTIEQIIVTPIRPAQLILGKLIPFAAIGLVEVLLVLAVAVLWFHVPLRGSLPLLLALSVLFLVTTQGLGLFVSTVSHTQQQAMMTAVFFVILPMALLSGFAFPIENMPRGVQYLTYLLPLRYFLTILRGLFLKGAGWGELWPQVAGLAIFSVAILTLAAARFHKRLG